MNRNFPTIGEYNQTIQNKNDWTFQSLNDLNFIPSKIFPIKIFSFGSGSYAVVFKATQNSRNYAIRCFLSTEQENINRYQSICNYLNTIKENWKVDCDFFDNEITVNGVLYPVLTMEWIEGVLINQFVTENLHNNSVLSELQKQLVEISNSLESHKIGHGDLQCGNIIVQKSGANFQIKLIDYDGMYIPQFGTSKSLEKGRSEFQHPKRTQSDFSPTMDRFSFWVILTALEALKYDKNLWREVMQGGFNTLDNFLFTIQDFTNPYQSNLFNRLKQINSDSVNFYAERLKQFCLNNINSVETPKLFDKNEINITDNFDNFTEPIIEENLEEPEQGKILIKSNPSGANVLTSTFQNLGTTPLQLDQSVYLGKTLIVTNGNEPKRVAIINNLIEVMF